ncbi:MAG: efflux RND transporter periplasmic adaptor subunit [Gemmatimonadetes bacterium]|nr:efflux RND transporter periplasmic adaptor subunit [Gemmatimonadota bacterium]
MTAPQRMRGTWFAAFGIVVGLVIGVGGTALLLSSRIGGEAEENTRQGTTARGDDLAASDTDGARRILYWRAPMDPNYTSDRPGRSPMGMDLVPVYEDAPLPQADTDSDAVGAESGIRVSRSFLQNFAVRTAEVRRGALPVTIRTVGTLAHNEERVVSVQTKYEGWIERASVNNVGETVARGDALFEIYSPQLVTTQREFLGAMDYLRRLQALGASPEAVGRAQSLLAAARERLLYWDMTAAQIEALAESQTIERTIQVFSPADGFIVEKMGDSMEGMKLGPGMTVLKIADHSVLWAETEFYEGDLRHVREGQTVTVVADAFPGQEWTGRILFFRPAVDTRTRTLTAFVEVANPSLQLRPMMYVDVTVRASGSADALTVPAEAILHSGTRAVAIVARGEGMFEPREVVLGVESDGRQEVTDGLAEGESVVVSSQFLIDSDANLRGAISQLLSEAEPTASEGAAADTATPGHNHN